MRLLCGNVDARVETDAAGHAWLRDYLSVEDPGARYSDAFQSGRWDGRLRLYREEQASFPTGLVRAVVGAAGKPGGPGRVEVVDERGPAPGAWEENDLRWLRDYQLEAARAAVKRTRGIVSMPTASGKTEVFCALGVGLRDLRWLVLVDTRDLMNQAADRFRVRAGELAGVLGDGQSRAGRFTVATLQSVHAGLARGDAAVRALVEGAQGVVVDECHVLPAESFFQVVQAARSAYYRFGTSATALMRMDAKDFLTVGALGPVVHRVDPQTLIASGVIARGRIVFVEHRVPKATGSFGDVYEAEVALSVPRNALVCELALAVPRPTMVFVRLTRHGRELTRLLGLRGLRVEFVEGATETAARGHAATRLQRGNLDALVVSKVFNKGVDLPGIGGGVNAAAGASDIDAIQRLGRFSRISEGKTSFVYADVLDVGNRWLAKHARDRAAAYRGQGYEVEIFSAADAPAALRRGQ